jgi:hypothetical protein
LALLEWVYLKDSFEKQAIQEIRKKLDGTRIKLETSPISPSLLLDEKQTFNEYHKIMWTEEETWRIKSRSIWLQAGDHNTKFFHRKAKAVEKQN